MATKAETGVTQYSTPSDTEVVMKRVLNAPRSLVFEAWTDCRHMKVWLSAGDWKLDECDHELRVGAPWRRVWRKEGGGEMVMTGTVREVAPPARLVETERWGPEWPETVNALELSESAGQTTVTMTIRYPSREARDAALKTGMKDGMEKGFRALEALLEQLAG